MNNMIQCTGVGVFHAVGEGNAKLFAQVLIDHSAQFTMTPSADGRWTFETKGESDAVLVDAFTARAANVAVFSKSVVDKMNEAGVYVDTASKDYAGSYVLRAMHSGAYIARVTPSIDRLALQELLACAQRRFNEGVTQGEKNIRSSAQQLFGLAA